MDITEKIKSRFDTACVGVSLSDNHEYAKTAVNTPVRFCEALKISLNRPFVMTTGCLNCPGARHCFGLDNNGHEIVRRISENNLLGYSYVNEIVSEIPVLQHTAKYISFTEKGKADVFIAMVKPGNIISLISAYAATMSERPVIPPYFIMAICGNVFVRAFQTGKICISFGCPESRKYAGIGEDEVMVGIPCKAAELLLKN